MPEKNRGFVRVFRASLRFFGHAVVDVDDLIAVILGWGPCWTAAQEDAPDDVESCYEKSQQTYPNTSSQNFIDAYEACIESLCRRGLLNCD